MGGVWGGGGGGNWESVLILQIGVTNMRDRAFGDLPCIF
jgi:hypothetical protein